MQSSSARAFTFGKNWRRFLQNYTPERQETARQWLLNFLKLGDLKGKSFLDIGCGSGIHSAAAFLSGAERIVSFDYDPNSVLATRQLHQHLGSPAHWQIAHGSVLDQNYVKSLGLFDIVYSWGVLHHTGDQWTALKNATLPLDNKSRLYIALYSKESIGDWPYWVDVKKAYNKASIAGKYAMEAHYIWNRILGRNPLNILTLPKIMRQYQHARGMHFMTDIRDWLGGWPTEFSSVPEVMDFYKPLGLTLVNLSMGEYNSELVFVRDEYVGELGYQPFDLKKYTGTIPVLENAQQLGNKPVWIFGTARGGDLIHKYLTKNGGAVQGFIDIENHAKPLHKLPVLHIDDFIRQQPPTATVILANRYFKKNGERLLAAGFNQLYNAHALVLRLHNHLPLANAQS